MNNRETFIEGVTNYLKMSTSGALMISGVWGAGKTYFIDHTLVDHLKGKYCPVKISLFGLEKVDNLERLITEKFLADYGEEKLLEPATTDKEMYNTILKWIGKKKIHKIGKAADSITEFVPYFKQWVDTGRLMDAYFTMSTLRLPKDNLVIILDDLERAVESIEPHLLLGAVNNLVETKKYKVIVVANDSYFNKRAENYLDFKEKVIERTLLFPPDIISVYKELVKECVKDNSVEFETLMISPQYMDVINPLSELNQESIELRENLQNIRIVKFALVHFAKIHEAFSETTRILSQDTDFQNFLLSLWTLAVGLSIEYKRNRLTYQDREAYIRASATDSFVVDLGDIDPNPFAIQTVETEEEKKQQTKTIEKIRSLFKFYIERRLLPLVPSIQVFDIVTAGVMISKEQLMERWNEYKLSLERQKDNPAIALLNRFMMLIGSFTNEEFPERLRQLAKYTEDAAFPEDVSYINAATYLQHYAPLIGLDDSDIETIIKTGIDKHFNGIVKLSPIAKSNLEVVASEVPSISKWVLDYSLKKLQEVLDKQEKDSVEEAIRQFKEDLVTLAKRLMPDPTTMKTPDFYTYPILAKIPKEVVIDKIKNITPTEVDALCSIIRHRFVEPHHTIDFKDESVFLVHVNQGLEARGKELKTLSDYLLKDHLIDPLLSKQKNKLIDIK